MNRISNRVLLALGGLCAAGVVVALCCGPRSTPPQTEPPLTPVQWRDRPRKTLREAQAVEGALPPRVSSRLSAAPVSWSDRSESSVPRLRRLPGAAADRGPSEAMDAPVEAERSVVAPTRFPPIRETSSPAPDTTATANDDPPLRLPDPPPAAEAAADAETELQDLEQTLADTDWLTPPAEEAPSPQAPRPAAPTLEQLQAPPLTSPALSDTAFEPWWQAEATRSLAAEVDVSLVDPHGLLLATMEHSPRVEAVQAVPAATQAQIVEAEAAFDLTAFLETSFLRVNDPVGNTLVTGGPDRLREENGRWRGGLRKRTATGGAVEVSQGVQLQDSNSFFFLPQDQGLSRLAVSISQPLLRGAGRDYAQRQIVLACIRNEAAWQEYSIEIQRQLADVSKAYWDLYLRRCWLAQARRHHQRSLEILSLLRQRGEFDAAGGQLARARAAVASRQVEIVRALRDVRGAETELRRLTQDPRLLEEAGAELVTSVAPSRDRTTTDIALSVSTSLQNRPEVALKLRELRAACLQHNISRQDLLPSLNLVFSGYLSGLRGDYSVGGAWLDQFRQGGPAYGAGLVYEAPWGRRAAKARVEQAKADLARLHGELRSVLADVAAEVEIAVQHVEAAHLAMQGRLEAMLAAEEDIRSLRRQWDLNPAAGRLATALLDELLDAQQRLLEQERAFAAAENEYVVAQVALLKAEGRLMSILPGS